MSDMTDNLGLEGAFEVQKSPKNDSLLIEVSVGEGLGQKMELPLKLPYNLPQETKEFLKKINYSARVETLWEMVRDSHILEKKSRKTIASEVNARIQGDLDGLKNLPSDKLTDLAKSIAKLDNVFGELKKQYQASYQSNPSHRVTEIQHINQKFNAIMKNPSSLVDEVKEHIPKDKTRLLQLPQFLKKWILMASTLSILFTSACSVPRGGSRGSLPTPQETKHQKDDLSKEFKAENAVKFKNIKSERDIIINGKEYTSTAVKNYFSKSDISGVNIPRGITLSAKKNILRIKSDEGIWFNHCSQKNIGEPLSSQNGWSKAKVIYIVKEQVLVKESYLKNGEIREGFIALNENGEYLVTKNPTHTHPYFDTYKEAVEKILKQHQFKVEEKNRHTFESRDNSIDPFQLPKKIEIGSTILFAMNGVSNICLTLDKERAKKIDTDNESIKTGKRDLKVYVDSPTVDDFRMSQDKQSVTLRLRGNGFLISGESCKALFVLTLTRKGPKYNAELTNLSVKDINKGQ